MTKFVYKLFQPSDFERLIEDGDFAGSYDDLRDGFLHFSTAGQLPGTFRRHYSTCCKIVLAQILCKDIADKLKWERSSGGIDFPHLYRPLERSEICAHITLDGCAKDILLNIEKWVKSC